MNYQQPVPTLVSSYRGYNIVRRGADLLAIDQAVGDVRLFEDTLGEREIGVEPVARGPARETDEQDRYRGPCEGDDAVSALNRPGIYEALRSIARKSFGAVGLRRSRPCGTAPPGVTDLSSARSSEESPYGRRIFFNMHSTTMRERSRRR